MAGKKNFAALRQHATKVHKFKQGASIRELDPSTDSQQTHGGSINTMGSSLRAL